MNRRSRWMSWLAVGAATTLALVLTGCVGDDEPEPSSTSPSVDEDAPSDSELRTLATATAMEFIALSDELFVSQVVPDRLRDVATDEIVANLEAELNQYTALGYSFQAESVLENLEAQTVDRRSDRVVDVALIACLDTSRSTVTDATGTLVPSGAVPRRPVSFVVTWQNEQTTVTGTAFPDASESDACSR